jgi:hydroxymethylpyrimidine/phosphomethylpyrimidine kinase
MLPTSAIIEAVGDRIRAHGVVKLVVDPVMVAKSGDSLLRPEAVATLRDVLLPLALIATPNLPEAEALIGATVASDDEVRQAAHAIHSLGARSVVVKGGHRVGDAIDVFYDGSNFHEFRASRIATENTHGTGCTFASAITAGLAKGLSPLDAVSEAKEYVTGAIRNAYSIGGGRSPVHHFYRNWRANENDSVAVPLEK